MSTASRGSDPGASVRDLHPAQFAMVMATGIISIGAQLAAWPMLARGLLGINVALYVALWILTFVRLRHHPGRMAFDLADHGRAVGFFTIVASTDVLGSQALLVGGCPAVATALWIAGTFLCLVLGYAIFAALTLKREKPPLEKGIHGGWLLPVVAVQSVAVLGGLLVPQHPAWAREMASFCLVSWLLGGMLYLWLISLIFYRYLFFVLEPGDLSPPYWINMGAMAISTLAGVNLVAASPGVPLLEKIVPFITGMTLLSWATATWWIPMLLMLGLWRHAYRGHPLQYDPLYWGLVFPLGMYAVSTHRLGQVFEVEALSGGIQFLFPVAFLAWSIVFCGLVRQLVRGPHRVLTPGSADTGAPVAPRAGPP